MSHQETTRQPHGQHPHGEPRYHHGRSPAAWAGAGITLVGFIVLAVGALTANWYIIIAAGVIFVVALIAARVLQVMGLGNG